MVPLLQLSAPTPLSPTCVVTFRVLFLQLRVSTGSGTSRRIGQDVGESNLKSNKESLVRILQLIFHCLVSVSRAEASD